LRKKIVTQLSKLLLKGELIDHSIVHLSYSPPSEDLSFVIEEGTNLKRRKVETPTGVNHDKRRKIER